MFEILPHSNFSRIRRRADFWTAWLIDACAGNRDPRQVIFKEIPRRRLQAYFIDHGEMFSTPAEQMKITVNACRFLDERVYPPISVRAFGEIKRMVCGLDLDQLWRTFCALPESWRTRERQAAASACLTRFGSPELVDALFHEMLIALDEARNRSSIQ